MSSLLILLFLPVVPGDVRYFFVSFVSAWATSLVTALNRRRNNYTMVIMAATVSNILAIAVYGLLFAQTWQQLSQDLIYGLLNGSLSAVAAIGLIPWLSLVEPPWHPPVLLRFLNLQSAPQDLIPRSARYESALDDGGEFSRGSSLSHWCQIASLSRGSLLSRHW